LPESGAEKNTPMDGNYNMNAFQPGHDPDDSNREKDYGNSCAFSSARRVDFMGVKVHDVDRQQLLQHVLFMSKEKQQRLVTYVNADCMLIARKNLDYRRILNLTDLVYPDGIGVVWGARLWGYSMAGRSTAADFMPLFCRSFAEHGLRLFFLGAKPGVAEEAAQRLVAEIPDLKVVGTHHGYFGKEQQPEIIAQINKSEADILLVGFGAPLQEFWIHKHKDMLAPGLLWGVGGLFDFLSGRTPRGPRLLVDHGFEWLCRLAAEPGRLWQRYLVGNLMFIVLVLHGRIMRFFKNHVP